MPDGNYELGGQPIVVKDSRATLLDGTLAGSCINMLTAVKNVISFGIPAESAVYAATGAAAKAIRCDSFVGSIEAGKFADMLILDREFNLLTTIIDGKIISR